MTAKEVKGHQGQHHATITHRSVLRIALPIVLSNATVPILGAVDVGVVGQIPEAAPIGAVGVGAVILTTLYWIFGFLRMGTVGLAGQAAGAGDTAEVAAHLSRALLIAVFAGMGLIIMQAPVFWMALRLAPATPEVEALTYTYLSIRIWTAPAAIAVYALTGWLVAIQRTAGVFWIQLVMNGINIGLDLLFVLGFGWGVGGVAVATAIAELAGAGLGLWFCRSAFAFGHWRNRQRVFDRAQLLRMAAINRDILIRSLLLMLIFSSFTFLGALFGEAELAANKLLIQFMYITAYAMDGFAFAVETIVARAYGRGALGELRRGAIICSIWAALVCLAMAVFFAILGPWVIDLMARAEDVRVIARQYLPWMVAAPILGCAAWMLDGIFIGATHGRDMRNMMTLSFALYVAALIVAIPLMQNDGLWLALNLSLLARGISLATRYPALERGMRKPPSG